MGQFVFVGTCKEKRVFLVTCNDEKKKIEVDSVADVKPTIEKKFKVSFDQYTLKYFDEDSEELVTIEDESDFKDDIKELLVTTSETNQSPEGIAPEYNMNLQRLNIGMMTLNLNTVKEPDFPDAGKTETTPEKTEKYCEDFKTWSENNAKEKCNISKTKLLNKTLKVVPLQLSILNLENPDDLRKFEQLVKEANSRNWRIRFYSRTPEGNVSVDKFFEKALELAEEESKNREFKTEEAKKKFLKVYSKTVAIVGQAGAGKTILAKIIVSRILEKEKLYGCECVFFVTVKELDCSTKHNLLYFLAPTYSAVWLNSPKQRNAVISHLKDQDNVVIIIDGLDEANFDFSSSNESKIAVNHFEESTFRDFIRNLLNGNLFPKAKKIITSRPRQLISLPDECRPHFCVNILGLDEKAQVEICEDICGNDNATTVQTCFKTIFHAAECFCRPIPLNCILVMFTLNQLLIQEKSKSDEIQPKHKSEVAQVDSQEKSNLRWSETSIMTLLLNLFKFSSHQRKDLKIQELSELAWNGIQLGKFLYEVEDLKNANLTPSDLEDLFVANREKTLISEFFFKGQFKTSFHFVGGTLQEYFAAIYLVMFLDLKEFEQLLSITKTYDLESGRFEVFSTFLFGLCNDQTNEYLREIIKNRDFPLKKAELLKEFLSNLPIPEALNENFLKIFTWLYELDDKETTSKIADKIPNYLIVDCKIVPGDIFPFHYLMENIKKEEKKVTIRVVEEEHFDDQCWKEFISIANWKATSLQIEFLNFSDSEIGDDGAEILSSCLENVKYFIVRNCGITAVGVKKITEQVSALEKKINLVDLSENTIGVEGFNHLSTCLHNVRKLCLQNCEISAEFDLKKFSKNVSGLKKRISLLDLSENEIGDDGVKDLSACFTNVKRLVLKDCNITSSGAQAISHEIKNSSYSIEYLNLSNNLIKDEGAKAISSCLHNVQRIALATCGFGPTGVSDIFEKIESLTEPIKSLNVFDNSIGDEGLQKVSSCAENIEHLEIGSFRDDTITEEGIKALPQDNDPEKEWYFYCNDNLLEIARDHLKTRHFVVNLMPEKPQHLESEEFMEEKLEGDPSKESDESSSQDSDRDTDVFLDSSSKTF